METEISTERTKRLKNFSAVLTEWLRKWARLYSLQSGRREDLRQLTREDFALYAEALSVLSPEQLDAACRLATERCDFFPTPAKILAQVQRADDGGSKLVAEEKWHRLLAWVRAYVSRDLGIDRRAPALEPAVEHAARAAGWVYRLESCSEDDLVWAKRDFIEAYKTVHETSQVGYLLGSGEAKRILGRIRADAGQRAVPRAALPESETSDTTENIGFAGARDILSQHLSRDPVGVTPELGTPAKHASVHRDDRRVKDQKRQLAEWQVKHKTS